MWGHTKLIRAQLIVEFVAVCYYLRTNQSIDSATAATGLIGGL